MPLQDTTRWDEDSGGYFYNDVADDDSDGSPEAVAERGVDRNLLRTAMHRLNANERMVVHLHYDRDLSLKEISEKMRLSQSRISQIHSAAIRKLRFHLVESDQAA
jgi:RNA polymerase sigma factor for flagellar operon FliA